MKTFASLLIALVLATSSAQAACYAAVKATTENPLRLYQGVVEISDAACGNPALAAQEAAPKVASAGLSFGRVIATFGPSELDARRANAGDFFIRR